MSGLDRRSGAVVALGGNALLHRGEPAGSGQPITRGRPFGLRSHEFAPGSIGPKVEAVCRFVERSGARAVIGSLNRIDELLSGRAGTQVLPDGPELQHRERKACHDRAA